MFDAGLLIAFKKYPDEHLNYLDIEGYGQEKGDGFKTEGCSLVGVDVRGNGLFPCYIIL